MPKTQKQIVGKIGEDVACKFLLRENFEIITRNYLKKWGEIDIIAQKDGLTHFVEVKTVSRATLSDLQENNNHNVTRGTNNDVYRPEDNVHPHKLKRLSRVIQTYLAEKYVFGEIKWQFDVIIVYLDMKNKKAKVKYLKNIIL